jgi:hypothetical protein
VKQETTQYQQAWQVAWNNYLACLGDHPSGTVCNTQVLQVEQAHKDKMAKLYSDVTAKFNEIKSRCY